MGRIVAGADFGSNKTGYIVIETRRGGFEVIERDSRFTRLAEGMGAASRIRGPSLLRLLGWCAEMRERFAKLGVTEFRAVGTEALRRATNQREVATLVEEVLGWPLEVIRGEEEGRLTFGGVRLGYPRGPLAILDIGGGSTELACSAGVPASGRERPTVWSLPIGAVILTERHGEDWDALCRAVRRELRRIKLRGALPRVLTVLGGTGANLAMMDLGERELDDDHVEGHEVDHSRLVALRERTQSLTPKQRVRRLGLLPQRADVQLAGLAILETTLDHLELGAVRTTRYALRHGVLQSLLAPR